MAPCCGAATADKPPDPRKIVLDSRSAGNPKVKHAIFVGNSGTGKTTMLNRIRVGPNAPTANSTIGVDFWQDKTSDSKISTILFWDTAGQERFKSIVTSYYKRACLIIAVFSLIDQTSYNNLKEWIDRVFENATATDHKIVLMVMGTHGDKTGPDSPRVEVSDLEQDLERSVDYYGEVSSVNGRGYNTFWKALEEYSRTGDIRENRTKQMYLIGIKPELSKRKAKIAKRKLDLPDGDQPLENPLPVVCE